MTGRTAVGILLAVLGGMMLATQGRVNGELGHRIHDGIAAALVSNSSGLLILTVATLALPAGRRGVAAVRSALRTHRLRWWHLAGGVSGGYFVSTQGLAVAALGLAVFTVAAVAGQVGSGLLVDRAGLGPGGRRPVTTARVVAAAVAVVAVVVAVADRVGTPRALALAVLPAVAGVAIAWQQAMNGRIEQTGGSLVATLANFATGTATIVVGHTVSVVLRGVPSGWPTQWWLYLGGVLGTVFVLSTVAVVRIVGVLVTGLGLIAGQVLASVAFDVVLPTDAGGPTVTTVVGAALTLVAVLIPVLVGQPVRQPLSEE